MKVEKAAVDLPLVMDTEFEAAQNEIGTSFTHVLRLDVRVYLAPSAYSPSYTPIVAQDLVDLLRFVGPQASSETEFEHPCRASDVTAFDERLMAQQESIRSSAPDASTVYAALRPPTLSAEEQERWTSAELAIGGHPGLDAVLLPYQRRTVGFLLGREEKRVIPRPSVDSRSEPALAQPKMGQSSVSDVEMLDTQRVESRQIKVEDVALRSNGADERIPTAVAQIDHVQGTLVDLDSNSDSALMTTYGPQDLGMWWERIDLSTLTRPLYFNSVYGYFTFNPAIARRGTVKASILAEEMGLGKTVELLALIIWNPAPSTWTAQPTYFDPNLDAHITRSKATLIIVPEPLRDQWVDEIHRHAPNLLVYSFDTTIQAERDALLGGYQPTQVDGRTTSAWNH